VRGLRVLCGRTLAELTRARCSRLNPAGDAGNVAAAAAAAATCSTRPGSDACRLAALLLLLLLLAADWRAVAPASACCV
jgi:hypothetical protein